MQIQTNAINGVIEQINAKWKRNNRPHRNEAVAKLRPFLARLVEQGVGPEELSARGRTAERTLSKAARAKQPLPELLV